MKSRFVLALLFFLLLSTALACEVFGKKVPSSQATNTPASVATARETQPSPTQPATPGVKATQEVPGSSPPANTCRLDAQLRSDTLALLQQYHPAVIYASDMQLAAKHFAELNWALRVVAGTSLEDLERKASQLDQAGVPYDALGYDLEDWQQTPEVEQNDPVGATRRAAEMAKNRGKQLLMVLGLKFMDQHLEAYAEMAAYADFWLIQSQRRMRMFPPGPAYRDAVVGALQRVRAGNPKIPVWVQISATPGDQRADPEQVLAYLQAIVEHVDGIAIFDLQDPRRPETLEFILKNACK